jgi:hypothetical protein
VELKVCLVAKKIEAACTVTGTLKGIRIMHKIKTSNEYLIPKKF